MAVSGKRSFRGKDPYSASKAAAEMIIQSYAASYSWKDAQGPAVATARGGNIIGGGDWSEDRLIPDFVRAVVNGGSLVLRYPDATRPWQHVLALVQGYLVILAGLVSEAPGRVAQAWNLGPHDAKQYSVRDVLELMSSNWTRPTLEYMDNPLPEAQALALDSSLARNQLGWLPAWIRSRLCRKLLRGIATTTQIPLPHEQFLWRSSTRGARRCDDDLCNRSSRTIGASHHARIRRTRCAYIESIGLSGMVTASNGRLYIPLFRYRFRLP